MIGAMNPPSLPLDYFVDYFNNDLSRNEQRKVYEYKILMPRLPWINEAAKQIKSKQVKLNTGLTKRAQDFLMKTYRLNRFDSLTFISMLEFWNNTGAKELMYIKPNEALEKQLSEQAEALHNATAALYEMWKTKYTEKELTYLFITANETADLSSYISRCLADLSRKEEKHAEQ